MEIPLFPWKFHYSRGNSIIPVEIPLFPWKFHYSSGNSIIVQLFMPYAIALQILVRQEGSPTENCKTHYWASLLYLSNFIPADKTKMVNLENKNNFSCITHSFLIFPITKRITDEKVHLPFFVLVHELDVVSIRGHAAICADTPNHCRHSQVKCSQVDCLSNKCATFFSLHSIKHPL